MAHREKASTLPEWPSGLSLLLTTATICWKDPDHMTHMSFSTLKSQCACCSQPNSNTRTIPRHRPSPSLLYFQLKETNGKSRTSYRVFQNKHLVWEPLAKPQSMLALHCRYNPGGWRVCWKFIILQYKNKHNFFLKILFLWTILNTGFALLGYHQ